MRILLLCLLLFQETQQQQQQQQQEQERQRLEEARRLAEERRLEMERKAAMEETRKRMAELQPPTAEERRQMRARMFPEFIKHINKFGQLTAELKTANPKDVRKKAGAIEDRADDMLKFILDWAKAPPPTLVTHDNTVQGKVAFLVGLGEPLVEKLNQYAESERKRLLIDINLVTDLIRDLQMVKVTSKSLR